MWRLLGLGELSRTSRVLVCEVPGVFFFFFLFGVGNTTGTKDMGNHTLGYNYGISHLGFIKQIWKQLFTQFTTSRKPASQLCSISHDRMDGESAKAYWVEAFIRKVTFKHRELVYFSPKGTHQIATLLVVVSLHPRCTRFEKSLMSSSVPRPIQQLLI